MAKRAKLSRIGRNDQLEILRVIRAGSRNLERAEDVALAAGAVTHLASNDFSYVGAVVHAIGPFRDLLGVARRAISHAFEFRFVRGDLRYRVTPVMTEFVERIDGEKSLRTISRHDADQDNQDQSENMSRHGGPVSWGYPVIIKIRVRVIDIAALPEYRRPGLRHRICCRLFIGLPLLSGGRGDRA